MKKLLLGSGAAALVLSARLAGAFTYSDNDLLLIFRENSFNDVEFNLGSVTNYLGLPAGTTLTVTGFDSGLVRSNFASPNFANVKFLLVAAANNQAALQNIYITDADPAVAQPLNLTSGPWKNLQRFISFVGGQAATATTTNAVESRVISPNDPTSYSYIASDGGVEDITTISGAAASGTFPPTAFVVENTIGQSGANSVSPFFQLQGNVNSGKPSLQIGSFSFSTNGVLTFTAGASLPALTPPTILGITRAAQVNTITIASTAGVNYRLLYTNDTGLTSASTVWTALPAVPGTGSPLNLQDTSADTDRFYIVEASY